MNGRTHWERLVVVSSAGAELFATEGAVVNTDDFLIATERKKQSAKIIVLEKRKSDHEHYVALADKAKELIEQKHVKDIDVYAHESLHDRSVITN